MCLAVFKRGRRHFTVHTTDYGFGQIPYFKIQFVTGVLGPSPPIRLVPVTCQGPHRNHCEQLPNSSSTCHIQCQQFGRVLTFLISDFQQLAVSVCRPHLWANHISCSHMQSSSTPRYQKPKGKALVCLTKSATVFKIQVSTGPQRSVSMDHEIADWRLHNVREGTSEPASQKARVQDPECTASVYKTNEMYLLHSCVFSEYIP